MGALTKVAFQSLKERGGIDTRGESEILATDSAKSAHVAKIRPLAGHRAGNLHPDIGTSSIATRCSCLPLWRKTRPLGLVGHHTLDAGAINDAIGFGAGPEVSGA